MSLGLRVNRETLAVSGCSCTAAEAGVCVGDRLCSVNGVDVASAVNAGRSLRDVLEIALKNG